MSTHCGWGAKTLETGHDKAELLLITPAAYTAKGGNGAQLQAVSPADNADAIAFFLKTHLDAETIGCLKELLIP